MIGWAAATGRLGVEPWALFLIMFLWQFPHFLAIAWIYRDDYARGGHKMLPSVDPDGSMTGRQSLWHAFLLVPAGLIPSFIGLGGRWYFAGALALGLFYRTTTRPGSGSTYQRPDGPSALAGLVPLSAAGAPALAPRPLGLIDFAFDAFPPFLPRCVLPWPMPRQSRAHSRHRARLDGPAHGPGPPLTPGKVAIWLFLATEIMFFTGLDRDLHRPPRRQPTDRLQQPLPAGNTDLSRILPKKPEGLLTYAWPKPYDSATNPLSIDLTAVNTFILICSSVTMVLGLSAFQRDQKRKGALYTHGDGPDRGGVPGVQVYEYNQLMFVHHYPLGVSASGHFTPDVSLFASCFFTMTGFHGAHVAGGVIAMSSAGDPLLVRSLFVDELQLGRDRRPLLALRRPRLDHPVHGRLSDLI